MIYLDYNATTPVLPEVLEAMMPYLTSEWGNPFSAYKFGSKLKKAIETARTQVAELIRAHAMEIIFTSCATESNNAAIPKPSSPTHKISVCKTTGLGSRAACDASRDRYALANILDRWAEKSFAPRNRRGVALAPRLR